MKKQINHQGKSLWKNKEIEEDIKDEQQQQKGVVDIDIILMVNQKKNVSIFVELETIEELIPKLKTWIDGEVNGYLQSIIDVVYLCGYKTNNMKGKL